VTEVVVRVEQRRLLATLGCTARSYGPLAHTAGQYAFLNVPSLSALEWHPFTISSAPSGGSASTFHVKALTDGSFTSRLRDLAASGGGSASDIRIDGPYGCPPDLTQSSRAVTLVAGGIGATPCVSIFTELHQQALAGSLPPGVQKVRLVWACRSEAMVAALDQSHGVLSNVAANSLGDLFELSICITTSGGPSSTLGMPTAAPALVSRVLSPALTATLEHGRPDLSMEVARLAALGGKMFVCGPAPMVAACKSASMASVPPSAVQVFAETFEI
jgi:ferredoxin-NADP reductase